MRALVALVCLVYALLERASAQSGPSLKTYVLTANQNVFRRLFVGKNAEILSTLPLCYKEYVNETDDGSTKPSNITGDEYTEMLAANKKSALTLKMSWQIVQLIDLDEKCQTVSMVIALNKFWSDCRLSWSSAESSLDQLEMAPSMFRKLNVYTPNVRLLEALNPKENSHSETQIIVYSNGEVWLVEEYSTLFSCNIDVSMYPFDIQVCTLTFESVLSEDWVDVRYTEYDVDSTSQELVGRYTASDQWTLTVLPPALSHRSTCLRQAGRGGCWNEGLRYTVILRRNPDYQLINLLFPAFLIVVISSFVFVVPPDGGDKMGLSVSILLSLYMFSQLMYDKMPETGSFPLLSQYFLVCIGLVTASCLYSSISAVFASASPCLPPTLRKVVIALAPFFIFDQLAERRCRSSEEKAAQNKGTSSEGGLEIENSQLKTGKTEHESSKRESHGVCLDEPELLTWSVLGALLDRVFFVAHFLATFSVLAVYLIRGYIPWTGYSQLNLTSDQMKFMCTELALQNVSAADLPCPKNSSVLFDE